MPPKTKSTPTKSKPPKRKRSDYDDDDESYAESSSASSDFSMNSPTNITTGAPTHATIEAPTEATTDAGTAARPAKVIRTTKVRGSYIQKAGSNKFAKSKARAKEKAGKEEGKLLPKGTDWTAMVLQKYPSKKTIATCDRCSLKFLLCEQEPDGCLKCKRNRQTCATTDSVFRITRIRGSDISQHVAAADAQLLARPNAAVQERDLLRAEVARNPSLREINQLRLDNKRLRQENERLERSLAIYIAPGDSNHEAAHTATQLIAAAKPRKPADNDTPTIADTEPWSSEYAPAPPSEYTGLLNAQSPTTHSTRTPVNNDRPPPANTNGRGSSYGTTPPGYLGSLNIRSPSAPSMRMPAQPNNGRNAPATDQAASQNNSSMQTPARPSSSQNAPATSQTTPLANPYTQAPSPLTYERPEHELATLPEFARPDIILYPELPRYVVSGIPGQSRVREVFRPEKNYLYRKPGEDSESNDDTDFDVETWDQ